MPHVRVKSEVTMHVKVYFTFVIEATWRQLLVNLVPFRLAT